MAGSGSGSSTRVGSAGTGAGSGEHRGGSRPEYSPNDDRAIVKNPTSDAYAADQANRQKQAQGG